MSSTFVRTVNLRCGSSSWGFRHIDTHHSSQWQTISNMVGGLNWRNFADWAISQSLASPYLYCENVSRGTVNYVALIQIRNTSGAVVATYYPRIPTGKTSFNVINCVPSNRGADRLLMGDTLS